MATRGRTYLRREGFGLVVAAVLLSLGAAVATAGALEEAFPPPDWKSGKSPTGLWVDCVAESCGPPAHAVYVLERANPEMASRIRSGALTREWAEQLAASFRRSQGDEIKVLDFTVQTGQVPGWTLVYRCQCEGRTSYVSSQIILARKGMMTFYSLANSPEAAQENMQKLINVAMGPSSR
ncbi:MAG TPA: hypothetical protein VNK48_09065 [Xanthobacteraceae bacterium]|nr:hypothetical protein [Xanthobacteraceae bacterium]